MGFPAKFANAAIGQDAGFALRLGAEFRFGEFDPGAGEGLAALLMGDGFGGDEVDPAGAEESGGVDGLGADGIKVGNGDGVVAMAIASTSGAAFENRIDFVQEAGSFLKLRAGAGEVNHALGSGVLIGFTNDVVDDVALVFACSAEAVLEVATGTGVGVEDGSEAIAAGELIAWRPDVGEEFAATFFFTAPGPGADEDGNAGREPVDQAGDGEGEHGPADVATFILELGLEHGRSSRRW